MSKRNRKKFKKLMRAQFEQEHGHAQVETSEVTENNISSEETPKQPIRATDLEIEDAAEVKHEITKILVTILILVLLIVGVYLLNIKTELILKAGEFIATKLNLSI